ncbi:hypothetical protein ALC53_05726 [Atta colombica]|uniref:Uncharacterized protein n=1 Tax=Atta colombica TaxID=520822 RepID=A0A195BGR8_9HYME|nr:hypothetical protein ALC53_05726 [Atta colombica]
MAKEKGCCREGNGGGEEMVRRAKKKMMMKKKKKMATRKEKREYEEEEQEEEAHEEIDPLLLCSSHAANTHATGLFHPDAMLNEVLAGGSVSPSTHGKMTSIRMRRDNFKQ